MAFITAETRSSIVELAMGMLNQAPSSKLLTTLIGKSTEGASLQDLADYIATTDAFTAQYPATQTAREFATEMFGKLITGGTLDADINDAVIDLLEGLLTAGTTKAEGFVAVINFLADSANADHPDLGDIAQAFQNRADAAEYFSITKELGGSTDEELAAAIASVTSDADTLEAANEAADATASSEEVVAGQTITLTTGIDEAKGTNGDETINASAVSASGADVTTLNSGDSIDGGAGTDTLNITATSDDNTSLTGVTIKNVEVVNITGADNINSTSTVKAAASAGAAQVQVIDVSAAKALPEIQTVDFGDLEVAAAGDGAITVGGVSVALVAGDTGAALATKVKTALAADAGTKAVIDTMTVSGGLLTVTYKSGDANGLYNPADNLLVVDLAPAGGATFKAIATGKVFDGTTNIAEVVTQGASLTNTATVIVNGNAYATGNIVTQGDSVENDSTAAELLAASILDVAATRTAVSSVLTSVLGEGFTVANGDQAGELKITSLVKGVPVPSIAVTNGGLANNTALVSVDAADPATVANAAITSTTTAVAQQIKYTVGGVVDTADSFAIIVDGVSYGSVNPAANSAASAATGIATALNSILGEGVAAAVGGAVTITAPTAGTVLPQISIAATDDAGANLTFVRSNARDNVSLAKATTSTTDAAISASSFVGAEQIWLKGDSNTTNVSNVTTQTIGLSGVTSMDNEVNYASTVTSGSINISGASGALSVKGAKLTTLNISGTGSAGTTITDGSTTDTIETLNVNASGTMKLTTTAMTDLTAVVSSGKGGLVLTSGGLESITTGEGADSVTVSLATVKDNANTAADETKNTVASTGDGADKVVVNTSGTGTTTVETGAGNDTVKLVALGSGNNLIELGAGDDTAWLDGGLAEVSATNVVDAGDGIDTLDITGKATYTAGDYTRYKVGALNFEKVIFTGQAGNTTAVDASKFTGIQSFQFNGGASNQIKEVSGALIIGSQAPTGAFIGSTDYLGSRANAAATGLTASALGYELDSDTTTAGNQTVWGGDLNITVAGFGLGASAAVVANSNATTITAASVAGSTALGVANSAPVVTLSGDTKAATFVLASTRVVSTTAGTEVMAGATVTLDPAGANNETLQALTSITVMGAGVVTIDASDNDDTNSGELETIDLSMMSAFANLNQLGESEGGTYGYNNKSTSTVTLNDGVAETLKLGAAKDTVVTKSTVEFTDSIVGFQLAATASTTDADDTVDTDVSDVLNIDGAVHVITADDTNYSSLDAALLALSATASTKKAFHADGNSYIYINDANQVLDDGDTLVELVGTYDLDLLVNVAS